MSNDVTITPGSGAKVATHDDGTAHHQRSIPGRAGTATISHVNDDTNSATLLAAASRTRAGVIVHNHSTATLFIKYASSAAVADTADGYTYKILPDQHWEMPTPIYDGAITCIWDANTGSGFAEVTELTI